MYKEILCAVQAYKNSSMEIFFANIFGCEKSMNKRKKFYIKICEDIIR